MRPSCEPVPVCTKGSLEMNSGQWSWPAKGKLGRIGLSKHEAFQSEGNWIVEKTICVSLETEVGKRWHSKIHGLWNEISFSIKIAAFGVYRLFSHTQIQDIVAYTSQQIHIPLSHEYPPLYPLKSPPPKAPETDLTECRAGPMEKAGAGTTGAGPDWILAAKYHLLLIFISGLYIYRERERQREREREIYIYR